MSAAPQVSADAELAVRVRDVIDTAAAKLRSRFPADSATVARDVVAAVLDVPRFWAHTSGVRRLARDEADAVDAAVLRLLDGMPMAYAVRRAPFRQLSLYVDERVLIPRPETEQLVDIVLSATAGGRGTAIDVGTGSGAIALALAVEGGFTRVMGSDVSADALDVAELNSRTALSNHAERGGLAGSAAPVFAHGSYLAPWRGERADVVVSNPPYIAMSEAVDLPRTVRDWEPAVALFASDDGMAAIAAIAWEAATVLVPGGLLALEVDARRSGSAAGIVSAVGSYGTVSVKPDLSGRARFVVARRVED